WRSRGGREGSVVAARVAAARVPAERRAGRVSSGEGAPPCGLSAGGGGWGDGGGAGVPPAGGCVAPPPYVRPFAGGAGRGPRGGAGVAWGGASGWGASQGCPACAILARIGAGAGLRSGRDLMVCVGLRQGGVRVAA